MLFRSYRRGDKGEGVRGLQQALNDAGYNCGKPDGIAGKKTFAAITQYRTDKGLEVSEAIDDALLEAMGIAAPQAQAEAQPQADAAAAAPDAGEDMNDYNVVSACYNNALAARLAELGVEGDIGQEAYKVTSADRKSTRLNSSHPTTSRMPSSA